LRKRTVTAINSVLATALVAAIVCVLYYLAERHPLRKDLTEHKTFSLSSKTTKILGGLEERVDAVAFFESGSGAETMVSDLLKEYSRRSRYFRYKVIDPNLKPSEARRYGISEYGVVFTYGDRQHKVGLDEIYRYSYNPYRQSPPDFTGEQAFTNAIVALISQKQKTICFLEGHGERDIESQEEPGYGAAKKLLEGDNYKTKTLNLAIEKKVPADCMVIAVVGPEKFFTGPEMKAMQNYLENGGRALFMLDPMKNTGAPEFLAGWGVKIGNDIVIDRARYFANDPLTPVPEYGDHDIVTELRNSKLTVCLPGARSVSESDSKPAGAFVTEFLTSSSDSWAETDMATTPPKQDKGADLAGPVPLAVAVVKSVEGKAVRKRGGKKPDNTEGTTIEGGLETRIVVVGDSDFASNAYTVFTPDILKALAGGAGNADLFLGMINWLAGSEELIAIQPKPIDVKPLNITGPQRSMLFWLCTVIIPVGLAAAGGFIWLWRRKQ